MPELEYGSARKQQNRNPAASNANPSSGYTSAYQAAARGIPPSAPAQVGYPAIARASYSGPPVDISMDTPFFGPSYGSSAPPSSATPQYPPAPSVNDFYEPPNPYGGPPMGSAAGVAPSYGSGRSDQLFPSAAAASQYGVASQSTQRNSSFLGQYRSTESEQQSSLRPSGYPGEPIYPGSQSGFQPNTNPLMGGSGSIGRNETYGQPISTRSETQHTLGNTFVDINKYSELVGWDRTSKAPDEVIVGLLNAVYDNVMDTKEITSEKRIYELVRLLKENLSVLNVSPSEYQKHFEEYLKRMIKDQKWSSLTTAQALCISVAGTDSMNDADNDTWFSCNYCSLSYPKGKFQCQVCLQKFIHVCDLQAHELEIHQRLAGKTFACVACNKDFPKNPVALRNHVHEKHMCTKPHLECLYGCRKLVLELSEVSIVDHIQSHHVCSKCKDIVERNMDEHLKVFHSGGKSRRSRSTSRSKKDYESSRDRKRYAKSPSPRRSDVRKAPRRSPSPKPRSSRRSASPKHRSLRSPSPKYSSRRSPTSHSSSRTRRERSRDRSRERRRSRSPLVLIPPPMKAKNNERLSSSSSSSLLASIKSSDLAAAQVALDQLQADNEARGRFIGEEFHYVDPPNKVKWPQCKSCKLQQPPNSFLCPKCNQLFSYRVQLFLHMRDNHKMVVSFKYECEICLKGCANLDILLYHVVKESHACNSEHLQCTYGCMNLFKDQHSLQLHVDAKHEFFCPICEAPIVGQGKKKHYGLYHPGEKFTLLNDNSTETPMEIEEPVAASSAVIKVSGKMSLTLAPRIENYLNQSFLNLAERREEVFLQFPPPNLEKKQLLTKTRTQLINMGFIYCKSCPLVYHPALPSCKKCNSLFLNSTSLSEHHVEVHRNPEAPGIKSCFYCGEKFPQYLKLVNHQVIHFCKEHTECNFGCKSLVVGGEAAVAEHNTWAKHQTKPKPVQSVVPLHPTPSSTGQNTWGTPGNQATAQVITIPSDEEVEKANIPKGVTLKCMTCNFSCDQSTMTQCDNCPDTPRVTYADSVELKGHMAKYHKLIVRGNFECIHCRPSVNFQNHITEFLDHRQIKHSICPHHEMCPNSPCTVMFPHASKEATKHLQMQCKYMPHAPIPLVSEGEDLNLSFKAGEISWKLCKSCKYTSTVTKKYTCENCPQDVYYYDHDEYIAHLIVEHKLSSLHSFNCSICKSRFGSNPTLWTKHRRIHGFCDRHVLCANKDCSWLDSEKVEPHKLKNQCSVVSNGNSGVKNTKICTKCSAIFSSNIGYNCGICKSKIFVLENELLAHIEQVHDRKFLGSFQCSECNHIAPTPYELTKHRFLSHKKCQWHKFCENNIDCPSMFSSESTTQPLHNCQFVVVKQKPLPDKMPVSVIPKPAADTSGSPKKITLFSCQTCIFTCNEVQKHTCSMCYKIFISRTELCVHMVDIHKSVVRGSFICTFCDAKPNFINQPTKLAMHCRERHKMCIFHKKCANDVCACLFPADMDISDHEIACIAGTIDKSSQSQLVSKNIAEQSKTAPQKLITNTPTAQKPATNATTAQKPATNATTVQNPTGTSTATFEKPEVTREKTPPSPAVLIAKNTGALDRSAPASITVNIDQSSWAPGRVVTMKQSSADPLKDPRLSTRVQEMPSEKLSSRPSTSDSSKPPSRGGSSDAKETTQKTSRNETPTSEKDDRRTVVAQEPTISDLMSLDTGVTKSRGKKQYICHHCNYISTAAPENNRTCRFCCLQFQFTYELCTHLMLEHGKSFATLKKPMRCDVCIQKRVQFPFSAVSPLPYCEHRWTAHQICQVHIICEKPDCSVLFPTKDSLELHLLAKQCQTFYMPVKEPPPPPPSKPAPSKPLSVSKAAATMPTVRLSSKEEPVVKKAAPPTTAKVSESQKSAEKPKPVTEKPVQSISFVESSTGPGKYCCLTCKHRVTTQGEKKVFICSSCPGGNVKFIIQFEYLAHLSRDHGINKDVALKFMCDVCSNRTFWSPSGLVFHRTSNHSLCKQHILCDKPDCRSMVSSEKELKSHSAKCTGVPVKDTLDVSKKVEITYTKVEASKEKLAKTGEASKTHENTRSQPGDNKASNKINQNTEIAAKYGDKESRNFQVHECTTCARKFACDYVYRCNQCPDTISISSRTFINVMEFFAHLASSHKIEVGNTHTCTFCSTFKGTPGDLQAHLKEKHSLCAQHFNCPYKCKDLFETKAKLLTHIQSKKCTNRVTDPATPIPGAQPAEKTGTQPAKATETATKGDGKSDTAATASKPVETVSKPAEKKVLTTDNEGKVETKESVGDKRKSITNGGPAAKKPTVESSPKVSSSKSPMRRESLRSADSSKSSRSPQTASSSKPESFKSTPTRKSASEKNTDTKSATPKNPVSAKKEKPETSTWDSMMQDMLKYTEELLDDGDTPSTTEAAAIPSKESKEEPNSGTSAVELESASAVDNSKDCELTPDSMLDLSADEL